MFNYIDNYVTSFINENIFNTISCHICFSSQSNMKMVHIHMHDEYPSHSTRVVLVVLFTSVYDCTSSAKVVA